MTEQQHVDEMPRHLQDVYRELRRCALKLGQDVHVGANKDFIYFKSRLQFAHVEHMKRRGKLRVSVRHEVQAVPAGHTRTFGTLSLERVPDSHRYSMATWFEIDSMGKLDDVEMLLRESYSAVS